MKILIIGLGNPILGDDGIGWRVAEETARRLARQTGGAEDDRHFSMAGHEIELEHLAVGGLSLMEFLIGYDRAILIDAIVTGSAPTGTVSSFPLSELPNRAIGHFSSAHDTTLQNALVVGKSMGAALPEDIQVVAIEAQFVYDFSEELSPPVAAAIPAAVKQVLALLDAFQKEERK